MHGYLIPSKIASISSSTSYAVTRIEYAVSLETSSLHARQMKFAIKTIAPELHEHSNTVHGIRDLLLAQNRDVHVLAIKLLVAEESNDNVVFPESVRTFARKYYNQKNGFHLMNSNGTLCGQYSASQRSMH